MNEIKRLRAWYKKRIENWNETICALGFASMILNLLIMVFFLVTKGAIGLLFLFSVVTQGFGISFLIHEHEIESREENLKIFLKKVGECCRVATTPDYEIKIAPHNYQTIPYDMLIKALEDYDFCPKTSFNKPFMEKDYECNQMFYLVRGSSDIFNKKERLICQ